MLDFFWQTSDLFYRFIAKSYRLEYTLITRYMAYLTILKSQRHLLIMKVKIIEPLLRFNPKNISQNHQKVKHQNFILITRNHDNIHWRTQNIPIKTSLLGEDQEKDRDDNLRGWRKRKVSMKENLKDWSRYRYQQFLSNEHF